MIRTLECPNCGGTVQLKYERTINAVCIQCLSILDATTPSLQILQKFQGKQRYQPNIPLGTRGKLPSGQYEAIGFQTRYIYVDGVTYTWAEYLLYNPYKGYRYLTEYNGHWNDIRTLRALPASSQKNSKPAVVYGGKTYTHFQRADATTSFVMGEFPWQVRVGETVQVERLYCAAGGHLVGRIARRSRVVGRYIHAGARYLESLRLKGSPPPTRGIYANQPSPYQGKAGSAWAVFVLLTLLLLTTMMVVAIAAPRQKVFQQHYTFASGAGEPSFVTPVFTLASGKSNVEVTIDTDLNNDWAFLSLALINNDTGVAYDFGKEISYYYGRDSDGSWSEGGRSGSVSLSGDTGRSLLSSRGTGDGKGWPRAHVVL